MNTGAFDPLADVCDAAAQRGAWVHVDGAIGLWAAASPALRPRLAGHERAGSWTTDGHKWLNVPYDSGLVFVRDPLAHRAAMSVSAPYFAPSPEERDSFHFVPESSRRARGFAVYAALRSLGRRGVAELVEGHCALARRMAERLRAGGATIVNDVVLNQVLVRFPAPAGVDPDALQREVIAPRAGGRHLLARRDDLARGGRAPRLGVELVDDRGRRRPLRGRDPALCAGGGGVKAGRGRPRAPAQSPCWYQR